MDDALKIRLVVFDLAGTIVDHGCFAPVRPFVDAFAQHGVTLSVAEARGPMGLAKKDHIRALFALPAPARQWHDLHGRAAAEADVDRVYDDFIPLQIESIAASSGLITGTLECATELRRRDVRIAVTTGYFTEAADRCYAEAARQGFHSDVSVCTSDVPAGRPAPWMMFRCMEATGVYPAAAVLKVGDTVPDIGEGLAAGAWTAGVAATGNDVGLTEDELAALPADERERRIEVARDMLRNAGAHDICDSVRDVPSIIDRIDARLARGEVPSPPRRANAR